MSNAKNNSVTSLQAALDSAYDNLHALQAISHEGRDGYDYALDEAMERVNTAKAALIEVTAVTSFDLACLDAAWEAAWDVRHALDMLKCSHEAWEAATRNVELAYHAKVTALQSTSHEVLKAYAARK